VSVEVSIATDWFVAEAQLSQFPHSVGLQIDAHPERFNRGCLLKDLNVDARRLRLRPNRRPPIPPPMISTFMSARCLVH
jgi:hypothetical protein